MRYDSEGRTDTQSVVEFAQDSAVKSLFRDKAHHVMLITG